MRLLGADLAPWGCPFHCRAAHSFEVPLAQGEAGSALVLAADGCGRRGRLVNVFSALYHLPRAFEDLSQDLPSSAKRTLRVTQAATGRPPRVAGRKRQARAATRAASSRRESPLLLTTSTAVTWPSVSTWARTRTVPWMPSRAASAG